MLLARNSRAVPCPISILETPSLSLAYEVSGPERGSPIIWTIWNPGWIVADDEFGRTAASFDNPDWAEITIDSYRVRWGHAPRDPAYEAIERRLAAQPQIAVPTLLIHGGADPVNEPATSEGKEALFTGPYRRVVLDGVGHFPQRQAADAVARELVAFLTT